MLSDFSGQCAPTIASFSASPLRGATQKRVHELKEAARELGSKLLVRTVAADPRHQRVVSLPVGASTSPVKYRESEDARKTKAGAISAGWAGRPHTVSSPKSATCS